jgi:hypothetical protein
MNRMEWKSQPRAALQAAGSLGIGALLLLLLMVAMGSATVYESAHSTEQAQAVFYSAAWFRGLLALLALNILAAVLARYLFRRRQVPFVITHAGLLTILLGALVTDRFGVSGQLSLGQGEKADHFIITGDAMSFGRRGETGDSLDLGRKLGNRRSALDRLPGAELTVDGLRATALRYLPRVTWETRVTDDSPTPRLAVELVLTTDGHELRGWVFPDEPLALGGKEVTLRAESPEAWERILSGQGGSDSPGMGGPNSPGKARIEIAGAAFEFPLEACTEKAVKVGDTGYTLRVLRYLPHAVVGPERTIVNASDRPANPAIEAEIAGPDGTETRLAFARFPDFHGRAGEKQNPNLKLGFVAATDLQAASEIEVLSGPAGQLAVRFAGEAQPGAVHRFEADRPVPTPWPGQTLGLGRRFKQARTHLEALPAEVSGGEPQPALLLSVTGAGLNLEFWLPKSGEHTFEAVGNTYQVRYDDPVVPLGFTVGLNSFRVGYYPGGERPRSYESNVTLTDPDTGRDQGCVISMNRPGQLKGFTLYQSSYRQVGEGLATVLSVARDPGRPIVFLGYIAAMLGIALALAQRAAAWRAATPCPDLTAKSRD